MGPNYIRIFNALKASEVRYCCDLDRKNLDKIKRLYSLVETTEDYKKVAEDSDTNAVVIITPLNSHYEIAKYCLERKKHVLIEKPFTSNYEQGKELMKIATKNDLTGMCKILSARLFVQNRGRSPLEGAVLFAPCRRTREKGLDVLIRATSKVVQRNKDLKLIIAGDGPERKSLERLTQKLGLTDFVRFLGKMPNKNMLSLYLSSDIVLLLSIHPDCFSRVLLETLCVGRPIIATNIGGNPEAVIHGFNGLLVPPKDVEETSKAILTLIENEELRNSMGKNGKRLAKEKFDPDRLVSKTIELYNVVGSKF